MLEQQWNNTIFDSIDIPQMDTLVNADYTEEEDIGKAIIEQFFTKAWTYRYTTVTTLSIQHQRHRQGQTITNHHTG
eukprot:62343-Amphidinium_carterae.1